MGFSVTDLSKLVDHCGPKDSKVKHSGLIFIHIGGTDSIKSNLRVHLWY